LIRQELRVRFALERRNASMECGRAGWRERVDPNRNPVDSRRGAAALQSRSGAIDLRSEKPPALSGIPPLSGSCDSDGNKLCFVELKLG
jgi:hypothetical protein